VNNSFLVVPVTAAAAVPAAGAATWLPYALLLLQQN
jgi:hypothetical protein